MEPLVQQLLKPSGVEMGAPQNLSAHVYLKMFSQSVEADHATSLCSMQVLLLPLSSALVAPFTPMEHVFYDRDKSIRLVCSSITKTMPLSIYWCCSSDGCNPSKSIILSLQPNQLLYLNTQLKSEVSIVIRMKGRGTCFFFNSRKSPVSSQNAATSEDGKAMGKLPWSTTGKY